LIRWILEQHGFQETESSDWNVMWMGVHLKPYMMQGMNKFQKVNHFPRTYEITRKDKLHVNITKMREKHGGRAFDFVPRTYTLPMEWQAYLDDYSRDPSQLWIIKPAASSRGRGISVIEHPRDVGADETCVVSRYVSNPLLIDGFKFDIRLYVLITSFEPLRVYVFEEGFARFSTEKFTLDPNSYDNKYVHLTNYSINKNSHKFVKNVDADIDDCGNKWSLSALKRRMHEMGIEVPTVMAQISDLIIKTLLSVESQVVPSLKTFVPHRGNCFELLGFDVMLSDTCKPWLLEVNLSPSLATDSPLDRRIKSRLIANMFNMIGVQQYDHKRLRDKQNTMRRAQSAGRTRPVSSSMSSKGSRKNELSAEAKEVLRETQEEFARRGGYVRIFPVMGSRNYLHYFEVQRAFNTLLVDSVNKEDNSADEARWLNPPPDSGERGSMYADDGEGFEEDGDVEMIVEDNGGSEAQDHDMGAEAQAEEQEGEDGGAESGQGELEEGHEGQPAPDNLYARKAVEEFLSCSMERLDQVAPILAKKGRQAASSVAYGEAVKLTHVGEAALSMLSQGKRGPPEGSHLELDDLLGELDDLHVMYSNETKRLEALQPPMPKEQKQTAQFHLDRFRTELSNASVEDLSRFLHRFVNEMPRMYSSKEATKKPPQQQVVIEPEFDYPGAAAAIAAGRAPPRQRARPQTAGATGRTEEKVTTRGESEQEDALRAQQAKANPMVVMAANSGSNSRRPVSAVASTRSSRGATSKGGSYDGSDMAGSQIEEERPRGGQRPSTAGVNRKRPQLTSQAQAALQGSSSGGVGGSLQVQASTFADRMRKMTSSGHSSLSSSGRVADTYGGSVGQRKQRAQSASRARPSNARPGGGSRPGGYL